MAGIIFDSNQPVQAIEVLPYYTFDKGNDFDFDMVNFPFCMVTLTGFTFLNLCTLLECLVM